MTSNSLNLKLLRVRGDNYLFAATRECRLIAIKDNSCCPNAMQVTQQEANEILNLLDLDNTLAFIHFNHLWEKYYALKNLR